MDQILECGHSFQCFRQNAIIQVGDNCDFVVGTEELSDISLKIFPIPAGSYFIVESDGQTPMRQITLFDLKGTEILKKTGLSEGDSEQIEVGQLRTGVYFVQILFENGQKSSIKLVKD